MYFFRVFVSFVMRWLLILLLFFSCSIESLLAQEVSKTASGVKYKVVFFISPSCKICQYYALPLRHFYEEYSPKGFQFEALVPSRFFSDDDIQDFAKKYRIPFPVNADTSLIHVKWNATITPEVFVVDSRERVVYHGRIDDSYAAIGKRRRVVNNHELQSILDAISKGQEVPFSFVSAVGCIIEKE